MFTFLKNALSKYSVQGMTVAGTIQALWLAMPDALQRVAPGWVVETAVLGFIAYGLIGRFVPQGSSTPTPPTFPPAV